MKRWWRCALMLLTLVPAVRAQAPGGPGEAEALRRQVLARWRERVRMELRLTDDQAARLRDTEDRYLARRRDIALRQRGVMLALRDQLEPGAPANSDSVRRLMEAREANRAAMVDLERQTDDEIATFLSPVQHARYQIMRQRLEERIQDMLRRRRGRMQPP